MTDCRSSSPVQGLDGKAGGRVVVVAFGTASGTVATIVAEVVVLEGAAFVVVVVVGVAVEAGAVVTVVGGVTTGALDVGMMPVVDVVASGATAATWIWRDGWSVAAQSAAAVPRATQTAAPPRPYSPRRRRRSCRPRCTVALSISSSERK
jgi:hypothetical protein